MKYYFVRITDNPRPVSQELFGNAVSFPVEASNRAAAIRRARVAAKRINSKLVHIVDAPEVDSDYMGMEPSDFLRAGS